MSADLLNFTMRGVRFTRLTKLHQQGKYEAIRRGGERWNVVGDGSRQYPWRCVREIDLRTLYARNLADAAETIACAPKPLLEPK